MREGKIKSFVKDHKNEILAGAAGIVIGACGVTVGKQYLLPLLKGRVVMPGFTIEGPFTIADIGKLGEEFMKHDPDLTKDTMILNVGHFEFE